MTDPTALAHVADAGAAAGGIDVIRPAFTDALGEFLQPDTLVSVLIEGLAKSAIYVMIALGLTLIFGLMGVLNFAHGSFTMIGAYLGGLAMIVILGNAAASAGRVVVFLAAAALVVGALTAVGFAAEWSPLRDAYDRRPRAALLGQLLFVAALAWVLQAVVGSLTGPAGRVVVFVVGAALVLAALGTLGGAVETTLIRPLYDEPPLSQILLTFGLTLVLDEFVRIVLLFYEIQPATEWQEALGTKPQVLAVSHSVGPVSVRGIAVFEVVVGVLTVAAVWAFLTRTRYGLYVRAGSEDEEMAAALGIDVRRTFTLVFALGAALAGVAGMLLMWDPRWGASVNLAQDTLLPAFVVVIIGGLGTFRGTVVAAVIVGMIDAVMSWWFVNAIDFSSLPELMIFLVLVGVLIVRPQGLFGAEEVGGH